MKFLIIIYYAASLWKFQVILFVLFLNRIVVYVKMKGFVGLVFVLVVMLVYAGHTSMLHGK